MNNKIKILIVDDQSLIRMGIGQLLYDVDDIQVLGQACDGNEAIEFASQHEPDVILMDIDMPNSNGFEATKKIKKNNPDICILMLTAYNDDVMTTRCIGSGASGYLTKDCREDEMVTAIREVYAGRYHIDEKIAERLALQNLPQKITKPRSVLEQLSQREREIVIMISSGKKTPDIANQLGISSKTVNTYRYRAFEKLGVSTDVELALFALQNSLVDSFSIKENDRNK